ncbi:MAG: YbaB/EbfC family nucleoid-associated protein [Pseudomonadota bacterium]|jgi:DNA-binding YbaB/EbfC family protein
MKNFQHMLKQAQAMQEKMQALQDELDTLIVEGEAGGGMVKAKVSGKGALKGLAIDPTLLNPEEVEILEDLIIAACNDARLKAEAAAQEKMARLSQGMGLPAGFKLPF